MRGIRRLQISALPWADFGTSERRRERVTDSRREANNPQTSYLTCTPETSRQRSLISKVLQSSARSQQSYMFSHWLGLNSHTYSVKTK